MLLGQRLGRRHQHRLERPLPAPATSRRRQPRSCRTRPPPSATAASARPESRSPSISSKRPELIAGRLERKRLDPAPHEFSRRPEAGAGRASPMGPLPRRQQRLVQEQLLEPQPLPGVARHPRSDSGKCAARIASADARQLSASPHLRRQSLDHVGSPSARLPGPLPDSLRPKILGRRMNRHRSSRRLGSPRGRAEGPSGACRGTSRGPAGAPFSTLPSRTRGPAARVLPFPYREACRWSVCR